MVSGFLNGLNLRLWISVEPFGPLCNCPAFHTSGDEKDVHRSSILVLISLKEGPFQRWRRCQFARTGVRKKDQSTQNHTFLEVLIMIPGNRNMHYEVVLPLDVSLWSGWFNYNRDFLS